MLFFIKRRPAVGFAERRFRPQIITTLRERQRESCSSMHRRSPKTVVCNSVIPSCEALSLNCIVLIMLCYILYETVENQSFAKPKYPKRQYLTFASYSGFHSLLRNVFIGIFRLEKTPLEAIKSKSNKNSNCL